jgi:hypothetical protein
MAKKPAAKRTYQLDLMTTLEAADRGILDYYDNLTEQERKAFAPLVLMRWLSTLSDNNPNQAYAVIATNDLVNLGLFQLQKNHPELVWKLMCVAGTGRKQYHSWIPNKKSSGTTPKLDAWIRACWPHVNDQELQIIRQSRDAAEWQNHLRTGGATDAQIKDISNELKKINTSSDRSE